MNNTIFTDKNLDRISFSADGREVFFDFIDMFKGNNFANVCCSKVSSFEYLNYQEEEGLPCYVGEVTCLCEEDGKNFTILGGEILIKIKCKEVLVKIESTFESG